MEKPKKILIFSTAYYPFVGGAEVAIKEITDRISDIQFDLITAKFKSNLPKFERMGNVNIHRLGFGVPIFDKLLLPFGGAFYALYLNARNNYEYYWCMMAAFGSGAGFIANIMKFWKPVPVVLTLQEGDSEEHFKNRWFGLINLSWRLALKNTKILTVISSYLADRAEKFGYKGETYVIPNGVDLKRFEISVSPVGREFLKEERLKIRKELNLGVNDTALVTTSRLAIKNGVGDVIKAMLLLPENVKFVIFGEGYMEKELKELAKNIGVSDRVIFKGFVSHSEMPKYLKACDIFVRASLSEGLGNSFIEAMASRLPVIATPVGGIVDFLVDPSNASGQAATGYFCQPGNPNSIVKAVERVMEDPQKNLIIENAYNMVLKKYDWDKIALKMKNIFLQYI